MGRMRSLIEMLHEITVETMPPRILEATKSRIADYTGIFEAGRSMPPAQRLLAALGYQAVLGHPEDLACWMGGATRLLDLDDGHRFAMGHPGVPILSAALAVVHQSATPISGARFLEAVAKGYEVYGCLGRSINPSAYLDRGFDATGICGAAGAAAAAGALTGLDNARLEHAVSIAATLCGGLNQYVEDGSSPKYLCAGWAAKLGISSVRLAAEGLSGPRDILEGRLGFCHGFSPHPNLEALRSPALRWEVGQTYLKTFGCVRRMHAALDCVERILERERLTADEIQRVELYGGRFLKSSATYDPLTEVKAQTCLPYVVSLLLLYREVTPQRIEENLNNPRVAQTSRLVRVIEDEAFNRLTEREPSLWGAARVTLLTKDRRSFTEESHIAIGDPEKPFPKRTIQRKFLALSREALGPETALRLWRGIDALEERDRINRLFFPTLFQGISLSMKEGERT